MPTQSSILFSQWPIQCFHLLPSRTQVHLQYFQLCLMQSQLPKAQGAAFWVTPDHRFISTVKNNQVTPSFHDRVPEQRYQCVAESSGSTYNRIVRKTPKTCLQGRVLYCSRPWFEFVVSTIYVAFWRCGTLRKLRLCKEETCHGSWGNPG